MTGAFLLVACAPLFRGRPLRTWSAIVAIVFLGLSMLAPRVLGKLNDLWFKFGVLLGRVTSPIFLSLFYYLALTPLALIMRLTGKDFLRLRRDKSAASYWILRTPPGPESSSLSRQF